MPDYTRFGEIMPDYTRFAWQLLRPDFTSLDKLRQV